MLKNTELLNYWTNDFYASEFAQEKARKYIVFNQLWAFNDFYFRIREKYLVVVKHLCNFALRNKKNRLAYIVGVAPILFRF